MYLLLLKHEHWSIRARASYSTFARMRHTQAARSQTPPFSSSELGLRVGLADGDTGPHKQFTA